MTRLNVQIMLGVLKRLMFIKLDKHSYVLIFSSGMTKSPCLVRKLLTKFSLIGFSKVLRVTGYVKTRTIRKYNLFFMKQSGFTDLRI